MRRQGAGYALCTCEAAVEAGLYRDAGRFSGQLAPSVWTKWTWWTFSMGGVPFSDRFVHEVHSVHDVPVHESLDRRFLGERKGLG